MRSAYKIACGLVLGVFLVPQAFAVQCYLTIYKASCWLNYNVTVQVSEAESHQSVSKIVIAKGKTWTRVSFPCEPSQTLSMEAQFLPTFWKDSEGRVYNGKRYWSLPKAVTEEGAVWTLEMCFPEAFDGVPYPPEAVGQCKCDPSGIPAVKLKVRD